MDAPTFGQSKSGIFFCRSFTTHSKKEKKRKKKKKEGRKSARCGAPLVNGDH